MSTARPLVATRVIVLVWSEIKILPKENNNSNKINYKYENNTNKKTVEIICFNNIPKKGRL